MWTSFDLTLSTIALIRRGTMGSTRESDLLSAAGYLCSAADNLRALGLCALADDLDHYVQMLDVEIFLDTVARSVQGWSAGSESSRRQP